MDGSDDAIFPGLFETAPDAVIVVDSAGRVVLANAQAEALFGYPRDELIGRPVELLVPQRVRRVHPSLRAGYQDDPRPRPMGMGVELAAVRKDGTEFPAEISLSAIATEAGDLVSAVIRDVTERMEARAEQETLRAEAERARFEQELQQARRLESVGQLAGGVAHDFNNLIAVIVNYAEFVRTEASQHVDDADAGDRWAAVVHDVEQIHRAGLRAAELTRQLLTFARREVVRPEVIDLNHVVRETLRFLSRTIGAHVEMVVDLTPEPLTVMMDPGQVEQVLMNLAVNARDVMPTGGRLTIATRALSGAGRWSPGRVELVVADTGPGMAPEVRERAFEPFFTTKGPGEGTGLGLATVHGIVLGAGGTVVIDDAPGGGAVVTITLPESLGVPEAEDGTPAARASLAGTTVLVIEDEDAVREVTTRILERHGCRVIVASNGVDALALVDARGGEIDVLLTDVIMPQMLGRELADAVRERHGPLPVLFMSGYAQPVLASQGTLDPGVVLLEKPFTEADLLEKLGEVLDRDR